MKSHLNLSITYAIIAQLIIVNLMAKAPERAPQQIIEFEGKSFTLVPKAQEKDFNDLLENSLFYQKSTSDGYQVIDFASKNLILAKDKAITSIDLLTKPMSSGLLYESLQQPEYSNNKNNILFDGKFYKLVTDRDEHQKALLHKFNKVKGNPYISINKDYLLDLQTERVYRFSDK